MNKEYDFKSIEKKWPSSAKAMEGRQDYDFKEIESKWQKQWAENKYGKSEDFSQKPKHYHLVEFPYPSGAGLHVGHCMGYGASDAYCRMKRMQGFNVMYPIGWDAFGLPTENYAIKTGRKPQVVTKENTDTFRQQMQDLGYSFDWDREVNTTDPDYYHWTQWIFLQFYTHAIVTTDEKSGYTSKLVKVADDDRETPRLAYQAEMPINWCPSCKTGLANEEVIDGKCERCGTETEKKMQKQWMLRITAYADRLIKDLETVDYLDKIKTQQVNWIGKSEGSTIKFKIATSPLASRNDTIDVYTTRADTLFGCTYVVLAPEHTLIQNIESRISNIEEVKEYIKETKKKSDLERTELIKDKTGVELKGIKAINPINGEEIPIFVADYVLASYGTGAVMAVPAHDQRDFEFATKYGIAIKQVIAPLYSTDTGPDAVKADKETVTRKMITAIVKHWDEDKIFCLNWEKFDWHSFILGGIDDGETGADAAKREVIEETGYQNIKSIKKIGFETHSNFFARHKDINRYSISDCFVVQLADEEHQTPAEEHTKNHKGEWIETKRVDNYITIQNNRYYWDIYSSGEEAFTDYGVLINSGEFDGQKSKNAMKKITEKLKVSDSGDFTTNFKLRDWVFSRQHYWGEPIPIVYCDKCGLQPLSENDLPLTLPEVEKYEPTNTCESPLSNIPNWVNTKCPKCDGSAKRETDTMPNWAGSSWYYLAYATCQSQKSKGKSKNDSNLFENNAEELKYWLPVDIYNGGMEHTTLHLLYSRFWHKFLYDLGAVPTLEPYAKRIAHGIILGPDGHKMSKSFGNVINPDDIACEFGADTLRAYIMFIGPYDQESAWSKAGVQGVYRFLKRIWANLGNIDKDTTDSKELLIKLNQSVVGVTEDLESFHLNTYIAKLMELNNLIEKNGNISEQSYQTFLCLLYPACPHIASELWESLGFESKIEDNKWPVADKRYLVADKVEIVVQINGKVREKILVNSDISDDDLKETALDNEKIKTFISDDTIVKVIVVPKKLVSIVVK